MPHHKIPSGTSIQSSHRLLASLKLELLRYALSGSAAFILIALALGTLAQPPCSLVIPPPFLCGLEGLTILFFLIQARFVHISQRTRTFTIAVKRTTTTHDDTRSLVKYVERPKLELIAPMMLQIWKVIFISGSWFTTTMAILYWLDWAAVQYCHCGSTFDRLPGRSRTVSLQYSTLTKNAPSANGTGLYKERRLIMSTC
ncbi:hypothetical protein NA56DRAFT_710021 [Hyaloscypha hepaticicola]|uniref:Uncharacterized protein n=1 Tax=Hyaloscypha hepaticicola TaxID=2082293 RepID=A0A2J6PMT6_9HELO|nr:hypothetical protein NA56DRAFT_710021 [Hyaloscypha hepaticicola]